MVAVIPPASEVLGKGAKKIPERRVRIRLREGVPENTIYVSSKLAGELGIKDAAQVSVSGKKLTLRVLISEDLPEGEVWANADFMRKNGISDNSMVTLRSA
ncbi:MAG: hypothetical protein LM561_00555 [Desulfurococcaceae archaeon]|nr:hypothetical protein [Desulfurococcaceae archaeon]